MFVRRIPIPALRPFVALLWASDGAAPARFAQPRYEHVLPGGTMHLVFRLTDTPLRILRDPDSPVPLALSGAMVGGVRSRFYLREMAAPSCSVGAVLRPGAATMLFGAPADAFAEHHTPLDALWGSSACSLRERLLDTASADERLALLESALIARLPRVRGLHPAIAAVLAEMPALPSVEAAVRRSGLSHRRFIAHFRHTTGLAPKVWSRVLRFQRALQRLRAGDDPASLATATGYSDQAHFNREFLALTGVTPLAYLSAAPHEANHLPMDPRRTGGKVNFLQYRDGRAGEN